MSRLPKIPPGVGPKYPQVLTLLAAAAIWRSASYGRGCSISSRPASSPRAGSSACRSTGSTPRGSATLVRGALDKFSPRKATEDAWRVFAPLIDYVPIGAGAAALHEAVRAAETALGAETRRLHYLSVPPNAALPAVAHAFRRRR